MNESPFSYDAVQYPTYALTQGHPDRLATIGSLFGMSPAPFERCRVLEVACSDGGNLIPMALTQPNSTFVGVDLAQSAIAQGQKDIQAHGLKNIELHFADLMDFEPTGEPFDYIIAHGFYSWVPEFVRDRLLEMCHRWLAPQGIAYVSYNVLPGCHIRRMLREMLLFHTGGIADPEMKMKQARAFLKLLITSRSKTDEYGAVLRKEAEWIFNREGDALLFHDDMAEINDPVYFVQFAEHADRYQLQYLGEANYFEMRETSLPPEVAKVLGKFEGNIIRKEQYLDFFKCRRFRQTLLCHNNVPLKRHLSAEQMHRYYVASPATPDSPSPSLQADVVERFTGPRSSAVQINHPVCKAALLELKAIWPKAIKFADLAAASAARLNTANQDADIKTLSDFVAGAFAAGMMELRSMPSIWAQPASERPVLWPYVRYLLNQQRLYVPGLNHVSFRVTDSVLLAVLLMLDGTHDRLAVAKELNEKIQAGELALPEGVVPEKLQEYVDEAISSAASNGLLIA